MNTKLFKGILLMLGVFVAAIQSPPFILATTLISAFCVGITYYVKNYFAPSNSNEGQINLKDIVSTVILAVVTAIGSSVANYVIDGHIAWNLLGKEVIAVVATYISTTFFQGQKV